MVQHHRKAHSPSRLAANREVPWHRTSFGDLCRHLGQFAGVHLRRQLDPQKNPARRRFSTYIQPISRGGKILHCVRVGRFKTWKQANEVRKKLKALQFDAVIVP